MRTVYATVYITVHSTVYKSPTVLKVAPTFFFSCIASCTPCRTLSHAVRIIHAKLTRRATIFALSRKCSRPNSFQVIPKFPPTNTKSPGRPHGSSPYHPPGLSHCVLLLALMLHSALDDLAQQVRPALAVLHRQAHLARQLHKLVIVHFFQHSLSALAVDRQCRIDNRLRAVFLHGSLASRPAALPAFPAHSRP